MSLSLTRLSKISFISSIILRLTAVVSLIALSLFLWELRKTSIEVQNAVSESRLLIKESRDLVKDTQGRVRVTNDNLNDILREVEKTAIQARFAAEEQRGYLQRVGDKTVAVLSETERTMASLRDTSQRIEGDIRQVSTAAKAALDSVPPVMEQTRKTVAATEQVIANPSIPQTLENVNKISASAAGTAANIEKTTGHIEKKVDQMTKPASFAKRLVSSILDIGYKVRLVLF